MISFLFGPYVAIVRYARILGVTTWHEIRQTYAGSLFGLFWLLLAPLILLSLYSVVFLVVHRVKPTTMEPVDYVLYIFSGLLPFLGFAQGLSMGTTSLAKDSAILLNTVFPSELIPFRAVLTNLVSVVMGLSLAIIGATILGRASPYLLLVPVEIALMGMFLSGIVWVLSLANLVLRDIEQVLRFATIALLVATPIAYTPDMVPAGMALLLYLNPLAYYVMALQQVIVLGQLPDVGILVAGIAASLFSFSAGFWVYQRAKRVMFDYA